MATPAPTHAEQGSDAVLYSWVLTTADHTGAPIGPEVTSQYKEVCWHASGTWGGATAAAEGSNTSTAAHFGAVKNADGGAAITFTADAGSPATQTAGPAYLRPKLTTVGVGATVTVTAYCRRSPFARGRLA